MEVRGQGHREARGLSTNLDLLRAIAVLCVFGGHTAKYALGVKEDSVWHFDQMGVLIFFVHTALVLMRSLDRMDETSGHLFIAFYVRRAFRIYPLSILCVSGAFWFSLSPNITEGFSRHWTIKELVTNLTLTQNLFYADNMWGGLWTLPLEVQMYVMLPFLFVAFRRLSPWWLLALWAISIPIAAAQQTFVARLSVFSFVPCFLGGVIAWRLEKNVPPRFAARLFPLALVGVSLVWLFSTRRYQLYHRSAFCLLLGLTLPQFHNFRSSWIVWPSKIIAKYSYGIYMAHMLALITAFHLLPEAAPTTRWIVFLSLAVILPLLMYHVVEDPMIRVGHKVASWATRSQNGPGRGGRRSGFALIEPLKSLNG